VVFASDAVVATVAWEEEWERYAVALFQRPSKRVSVDPIAKRVNDTGKFVTKDSTLRKRWSVSVAPPYVEI
jgi:hypothetical protein